MACEPFKRLIFSFLLSFTLFTAASWHDLPASAETGVQVDDQLYLQEKLRTNAGAVSIMVSGLNCTCAHFAEDIRNVVNELKPGGQRALISLGEGGPHNLKDAIFLLGVHMTIVDENTLALAKQSNPVVYGDIEDKIRYVTKLYNAEFHILARREIASVGDLNGKAVNVELMGSQTDQVVSKIFGALGVEIERKYFDDELAKQKLLSGEIAAMVISDGAPRESLLTLKREDGIHFLPLDQSSVPGTDLSAILTEYLPTELTSDHYPNLISLNESVPTVASRMVLAIYNWPEDGERYRRNTQFIDVFFSRIDEFRHPSRHPKWKDVNIAAEVPGWTRFKPAREWLERHNKASPKVSGGGGNTRAAFEQFLAQRTETSGDEAMSEEQRERLFRQFQQFIQNRNR